MSANIIEMRKKTQVHSFADKLIVECSGMKFSTKIKVDMNSPGYKTSNRVYPSMLSK